MLGTGVVFLVDRVKMDRKARIKEEKELVQRSRPKVKCEKSHI